MYDFVRRLNKSNEFVLVIKKYKEPTYASLFLFVRIYPILSVWFCFESWTIIKHVKEHVCKLGA